MNVMKRRLPYILAIITIVAGALLWRGRQRAQAEADLWAAATDEI